VYGATDTDRNYVKGILGTETIKFGSNDAATVQSFTFGCTNTVYRNDLFDGYVNVLTNRFPSQASQTVIRN
jgi:hypothetical protein